MSCTTSVTFLQFLLFFFFFFSYVGCFLVLGPVVLSFVVLSFLVSNTHTQEKKKVNSNFSQANFVGRWRSTVLPFFFSPGYLFIPLPPYCSRTRSE